MKKDGIKAINNQGYIMHSWGDDWPNWDTLYKAENYFGDLYFRCTGKHPQTKEKWGSIRYDFTCLWIESAEHCRLFRECIRRTVKKFPEVAGELVGDAAHVLKDDYFEGWCNGVSFITRGSYWSSTKRPKGV